MRQINNSPFLFSDDGKKVVGVENPDGTDVTLATADTSILKVNSSFLLNPSWNYIDPATDSAFLSAPGTLGSPNYIGSATGFPVGTQTIHNFVADASYPAGAAALAAILAGYDDACNQIAGFIAGGFHSYIMYNADGHSAILSGSYHLNKAGRAVIVAGNNHEMDTSAQFGFLGNGRYSKLTAQFASALNGQNNLCTGVGASILYGDASTCSGVGSVGLGVINASNAGDYALMHGNGNTIDSGSAYADVGGLQNDSYSGYAGLIRGSYNGMQNPGGVIFADKSFTYGRGLALGREIHHNQPGAVYLSNNKLSAQGDNGSFTVHGALRTTNATPANMNVSIAPTSMLAVPDNSSWAVEVLVNATNEDTLAVNTWTVRADVKRINGVLAFVAAATITARAAESALAISMTVSAAAGLLRLNCTGIAATNIKWAAQFNVVETRGTWSDTFTADATTNDITLVTVAKALQPGEKVRLTTSGTLPGGLALATDYWVYLPTGPYYGQNFFKLATTPSGVTTLVTTSTPNATSGISIKRASTVSSVIDITSAGSGTHTITRV